MNDLTFLTEFIDPVILGICLLVGYVLKTAFDWFKNKYIPLTVLCLGAILAVIVNIPNGITVQAVFGGMVSGLASTGMYEMLRNLLNHGGEGNE